MAAVAGSGTSLIERGTPAFRRTNLALFAAGFATFALLYPVPHTAVLRAVIPVGEVGWQRLQASSPRPAR